MPSSSAPIKREYPATSAARIAARRRTGGICRAVVDWVNQLYPEIRADPKDAMQVFRPAAGIDLGLSCTPNGPISRRLVHLHTPATATTAAISSAVLWPGGTVPRRRGRIGASDLARSILCAPSERQHDKRYGKPSRSFQRRGAAHSMTSSARARIDCGTVRPSAFQVFRLITNSTLFAR